MDENIILKVEKKDGKYITTINGAGVDVGNALGLLLINIMETSRDGGQSDEEICQMLLDLQTWALEEFFKTADEPAQQC